MEACRMAVRLEPGRPEAYCLLLSHFVETDGSFSLEEELLFREVLELDTEKGNALEVLRRHKPAYGRVAYEIGLAYFYDYEGSGGRRASAVWLLALSLIHISGAAAAARPLFWQAISCRS